MKIFWCVICCFSVLLSRAQGQPPVQKPPGTVWVFTYLKAKEGQKADLRAFVERNWFAMDSVAVEQGLFKTYELYENQSPDSPLWDFIVAVQYFTARRYADVADRFEQIRRKHKTVLINGKPFNELGSVVSSTDVVKYEY